MVRRIPEVNGYHYCEGNDCDYKSKTVKGLVYFKGRHLCFRCKNKASKCLTNIPKLDASEETIRSQTRLPEGRYMPKEKYKDYKRVTPELRNWAVNRSNKVKVPYCGLTSQEHKILWHHFYIQGLDDEQIEVEINKVKEQIKKSHELAKDRLRENAPTFKEEFEKLVGLRA